MSGSIRKTSLGITGMTCAACLNKVEKSLNKSDEANANANPSTEKATIKYNPSVASLEDITSTIQETGYGVLTEKVDLDVMGMTCAACSNRVEKVLNRISGVSKATVNLTTEGATVEYSPDMTPIDEFQQHIKNLGCEARPKKEAPKKGSQKEEQLKRRLTKLAVSAALIAPLLITIFVHLFGIQIPHTFMSPWFQFVLATPVQLVIGWQFYIGAYKSLRNGSANMDILVALGINAAFFYSIYESIKWLIDTNYESHLYFETSAVLIALILFGEYLEAHAKTQTTNALSKLLNLQAKEARILRNGEETMVPLSRVKERGYLVIKPGEEIPVDGKIVKGMISVNESMLTGESIPVEEMQNDNVIGSTMSKNGVITAEATEVGKGTALASIVKVVEEAQGSRAPIQRLADITSGCFIPIVVGIAIFTFIIWISLVQPGRFKPTLAAAIAVLVIACPCALDLATPTSTMVGTRKVAENGILFKDGEHIEGVHAINTATLDKTDTITNGIPEVTDSSGDDQTLQLLASAEKGSEHPLTEAIVSYAKEKSLESLEIDHFEAIPGRGINAAINDKELFIGNRKLVNEKGVQANEVETNLAQSEKEGKTATLISVDNELRRAVAVVDTVKDTAQQAIQKLHELGVEVAMLTGDNKRTAQAIAKQVGIDTTIAKVLPEEKASKVAEIQSEGRKVAMVGDGVSDAPALVKTDIGIAIGTGTEAAVETADITILGRDLLLIPKAVKASKSTIRNIRQNLFWASGYNVAGIPIAAVGLLTPWVVGAAMALSSISVVASALRLKRMKL